MFDSALELKGFNLRNSHSEEHFIFLRLSASAKEDGRDCPPAFFFKWELNARLKLWLTFLFSDCRSRFARNMPERISVSDFVVLTNEDLSSPGASSFQSKMSDCRSTVSAVEEVRDVGTEGGGAGDLYCLPVQVLARRPAVTLTFFFFNTMLKLKRHK